MTNEQERWHYRFDNFKRAYFLLQEAAERHQDGQLSQLAKEGMIQRFEYCTELAWKTIKDYLESQNVVFEQITPRAVVKEAVAAKLISNGEDWMSAVDARNKMSHVYDVKQFDAVIEKIEAPYLDGFGMTVRWNVDDDVHVMDSCWRGNDSLGLQLREAPVMIDHGLSEDQLRVIKETIENVAPAVESVCIWLQGNGDVQELFRYRCGALRRPQ